MILVKAGGGKNIDWDTIGRDLAGFEGREQFVIVHGASVLRDEIAARLSIPVRTVVSPSGIPSVYTDKEAIEVFLMAYAGVANKTIVASLRKHGLDAVAGLADHIEVGLHLENVGDALTEQLVIVGQQHANLFHTPSSIENGKSPITQCGANC